MTQWVGTDGVVHVIANGYEQASLDANAPENSLPDWNGDGSSLDGHVEAYWVSMGVPTCAILTTSEFGGSSGTIVHVSRAVDGIPIEESLAAARFESNDKSAYEEGALRHDVGPADGGGRDPPSLRGRRRAVRRALQAAHDGQLPHLGAAPSAHELANHLRGYALRECEMGYLSDCANDLDRAKSVDPEGEKGPAVQKARSTIEELGTANPPGQFEGELRVKGPLGSYERRLQKTH